MKTLTEVELAGLRLLHGDVVAEAWTVNGGEPIRICRENAAFLVAANNLVPRLLEEVERLRGFLKRVEHMRSEEGGFYCLSCGSKPSQPHRDTCEVAPSLGASR